MIEVTKYRATDGSEWATVVECIKRDELDAKVSRLESRLGPRVDRGRRAIDPMFVAGIKREVVSLCRHYHPTQEIFHNLADDIHPFSYAGRFLSEVGGPLNRIWRRFMCMDSAWEYEQPFFALNPGEFEKQHPEPAASVAAVARDDA